MSSLRVVALALVGIALFGCDRSVVAGKFVPTAPQEDAVPVEASAPSLWTSEIVDTTGRGASYAMFVPRDWDKHGRRLVVFVHGLVYQDFAVALPAIDRLRDTLGTLGFAVAYSSFSENGWAVKDGAQRSHQLRELFASRFGEPASTYIYGRSLGGLIGIMLAERYPEEFSGVFAECGLVAGTSSAWAYLFDVRRLFDYFYPGVLRGNALGVPEDWQPGPADATLVTKAMQADMTGALTIAKLDQTPIPFASAAELRAGILDVLTVHTFEVNDIMDRSHGRPPLTSSTFTATNADGSSRLDPTLLESINRNTLHFEAAADAANLADHAYEPSGDLRIPVMTFITSRDPRLPPALNDLVYQSRVDAAGRSNMFAREQWPGSGHCAFPLFAERVKRFLKLVSWAESAAP